MAIAFDTSTIGGSGTASYSHTCTGTNLALFVAIDDVNANVTGVTYNGVSMTLLNSVARTSTFGSTVYIYYLLSPATGSNTVSISKTSGTAYTSIAASYTGVSQSGMPDSSNTGSTINDGGPATVSTTVVASDCWLIGAGGEISGVGANPSTDKTDRRISTFTSVVSYGLVWADSNATVGTGSQSITFSKGGGGTNYVTSGITVSIAPGVAPVNNSNFLMFM